MDVHSLKKELSSASESKDEELTKDILSRLSSLPITKELIQSSGIGLVLGKLGKCDWSPAVAQQAKDLVGEWKTKLKKGGGAKAPSVKPFAPVEASPPSSRKPSRQSVSEPVVVKEITGERKRDTIIAKLNGAMRAVLADAAELGMTEESLWEKATEIEAILNRDYSVNQHDHKTKFLQLVRNLRDENNSQLRLRVAVGNLTCEELMQLSAFDLAPEDVQSEIKDLKAYNKEASKARKAGGEITTRFGACAKCKSPKASYFMMQTRSADEPMTVFITCVVCGHSWRK